MGLQRTRNQTLYGLLSAALRSRLGISNEKHRRVMISKRGNKNFYKGYGAQSHGFHTKKGGYIVDFYKVPSFTLYKSYKPSNEFYPIMIPKVEFPTPKPISQRLLKPMEFVDSITDKFKKLLRRPT